MFYNPVVWNKNFDQRTKNLRSATAPRLRRIVANDINISNRGIERLSSIRKVQGDGHILFEN